MIKQVTSEFRLYLCNRWIAFLPSHTFRLWFYKKIMKLGIRKHSSIHMGCQFDCANNLEIGQNSVINGNCRLDNRGGIKIGDNVSISQEVVILTADHDLNSPDFAGRNKKVVIENYVWIGTRAMILPGVTIQEGAVIAAGAIVTKDVLAYNVVAGIPAKTISIRSNNLKYSLNYRRLFQ